MLGQRREFAVVDVETTGFSKNDRVIEIGIVVLDHSFKVINEYETLIDPERDLGATHVHRITPQMISMAPRFDDVAQAIAGMIDGRILVAHNLSFDQRFLKQEFERLNASFAAGSGICTYKITKFKLPEACSAYEVPLPDHHRALADSRACADLLRQLKPNIDSYATTIEGVVTDPPLRSHRRCATQGVAPMERMYCRSQRNNHQGAIGEYHNLLDWTLDNLDLDSSKQAKLNHLARELELSEEQIAKAHKQHFQSLALDAKRNGVITKADRKQLAGVAKSLGVSARHVPKPTVGDIGDENLPVGASVCFTGSFVDGDGHKVSKADLSGLAIDRGLVVVESVTKSECDAVVAVDVSSSSGKAKRARELGKPVISSARFLQLMQSRAVPKNPTLSDSASANAASSDFTQVRPSASISKPNPRRPPNRSLATESTRFKIRQPPQQHSPSDLRTPAPKSFVKTNFPRDSVVFFGKGKEVQLGKAKLKNCFVYGSVGGSNGAADASLIDASLPLSKPNGSEVGNLPYWPSYLECTASQRYRYLQWLITGRRDPDVELGFVFIYFYGLERRVLIDQADFAPIANELIRLLLIYRSSNSFRRYATTLLWTTIYLAATKEKVAPKLLGNAIKITKKWTDESLGLCLGILQTLSYRLPIRLARVIAERDARTTSSVIVGRHHEEFQKLFKLKYLQQYEKGMVLVAAKRAKTVDYFPASGSLHRYSQQLSNLPKCPHVMGKPAQFKPLISIWNESIDSLKTFSRASRKSSGEMTTAVYEALPPEIRDQQHPELSAWLSVWKQNVDENGWPIVPVSDLASIKEFGTGDRLTKAECIQLLTTADVMGFAIEPDFRLTGEKYKRDEKVTLYCCEGPAFEDTTGYSAASILLRLGASIAEADGVIDPRELRYIGDQLHKMFDFSEVDSKRLESLQYLLLKSRSGNTAIGKTLARKLSRKHRQVVGEFLVGIAASDEEVCEAEIAALRIAYRTLEIDEEELDRLLLPYQPQNTGIDDPDSSAVQIDPAVIAQIMAETREVAELLRQAMTDDSEDPTSDDTDSDDTDKFETEIKDVVSTPGKSSEPIETEAASIVSVVTSAVVVTSNSDCPTADWTQLTSRFHPLLRSILSQNEWSVEDFQRLCSDHSVMQSGAIEVINEWSTEQFGDWLIEEADHFVINKHLLTETDHDS